MSQAVIISFSDMHKDDRREFSSWNPFSFFYKLFWIESLPSVFSQITTPVAAD
jgi:hypothetical protein